MANNNYIFGKVSNSVTNNKNLLSAGSKNYITDIMHIKWDDQPISGAQYRQSITSLQDFMELLAYGIEQISQIPISPDEPTLTSIQWESTTMTATYGEKLEYPNLVLIYSDQSQNIIKFDGVGDNNVYGTLDGDIAVVVIENGVDANSNVGTYRDITAMYNGFVTETALEFRIIEAETPPDEPALITISWESSLAVDGPWGTTPYLGNIIFRYADDTTQSKAYNASGVSLYTDFNCTTPFSNEYPGRFSIWATYTKNGNLWKTSSSKTVILNKKDLTITKVSSPSSISDGSTRVVTFKTNVSATITLTTTSGTGWSAQLTSSPGTEHTIEVTNTTGGSAGAIAADAIKVKAVATDTDRYNNITTATGVNDKIILFAAETTTTYYWYVGQSNPNEMTTISPIVNDTSSPGWREIGTSLPTYSSSNKLWSANNVITTGTSLAKQYIAIPANSSACPRDGAGNDASTVDIYNKLSNVTISGVEYKVYETVGNRRKYDLDTY